MRARHYSTTFFTPESPRPDWVRPILPILVLLLPVSGQETCPADEDGDGWTIQEGDCDDGDPSIHPQAPEGVDLNGDGIPECDGIDNDCDYGDPGGGVDEGTSCRDDDYDGYSEVEGDCDDLEPSVYPGAPEGVDLDGDGIPECDGRDNNCDGRVDEGASCRYDGDGDGYGALDGDCDDADPARHPGAFEGVDADGDGVPDCDQVDNDCDGTVDNGTSCRDDDGDGYSELDGDCDDTFFYTYPGALERSDLLDNNCDGLVEGTLTLARAHVRLAGGLEQAQAGYSVSSGNDVNGDGIDDLLVGAPNYDQLYQPSQGRGAVFLILGRPSGWTDLEGTLLPDAGVLLYEDEPTAKAGMSVAIAGDMNGDGYGDFAVGVPYHSTATTPNVGQVYLVLGKAAGWGTTTLMAASAATVVFSDSAPEAGNMLVGYSLAGDGDLNDDGYDDLAIGVPWVTQKGATGWVAILPGGFGTLTGQLRGNDLCMIAGDAVDVIGMSTAITGRNNADGTDDLVIGSQHDYPNSSGSVYAVLGSHSFVAGTQYTLPSLYAPEYFGRDDYDYVGDSVSGGVDADNDGFDEILVGRKNNEGGGFLAYMIFGRTTLPPTSQIDYVPGMIRFVVSSSGLDECPCVVRGIGDMNGDGLDDLAIAAVRNDENGADAGKIYIFFGKPNRETWGSAWSEDDILDISVDSADLMILGEVENDWAGDALASGDINGDGLADLVVGVRHADSGGLANDGKVYVVFGAPSATR